MKIGEPRTHMECIPKVFPLFLGKGPGFRPYRKHSGGGGATNGPGIIKQCCGPATQLEHSAYTPRGIFQGSATTESTKSHNGYWIFS